MSAQIVEQSETMTVKLSKGDYWVHLSVRLQEEYNRGDLLRLASESLIVVEAADDLSAGYGPANWLSGVASGALYAFRALKIPRRVIQVMGLAGRLRAGDMPAIANSAALAIASLVQREAPLLELEGWQSVSTENGTGLSALQREREAASG